MKNIVRKRGLRCLGHVWRMDKGRRANQALHWVPEGRQRKGRLRKKWTETVKSDLSRLEIIMMAEGGGAGNGQSRVEKMRCPMYINVQDGLRYKVRIVTIYHNNRSPAILLHHIVFLR